MVRPRSTKRVASVTMKEGSPVRTTRSPLPIPTPSEKTTVTATAGQKAHPKWLVRSRRHMPAAPIMDPTERSNSPRS
jgi:hypothetical protein